LAEFVNGPSCSLVCPDFVGWRRLQLQIVGFVEDLFCDAVGRRQWTIRNASRQSTVDAILQAKISYFEPYPVHTDEFLDMVQARTINGTLIYLAPMPFTDKESGSKMNTQKRQFGLALMLLTSSVLALCPTLTFEKPQHGSAVVSIKAGGQASPDAKAKPSSALPRSALTLYGTVEAEGNGALRLDNLAGSLQIGITYYTITNGKGEVDKKGKIEINAKTTSDSNKKLELILHGDSKGKNVAFNSKESKLSSLYSLSLKGQATVTMPPTTNTSSTRTATEAVTSTWQIPLWNLEQRQAPTLSAPQM